MNGLMNYLRGSVRVNIEGAFPERILNLCAQNGVEFWAVEWKSEINVSMTLRKRGVIELERFIEKLGFNMYIERTWGVMESSRTFQTRHGFLIGLFMVLCAVTLLSQFILTVELSGNERVEDAVILQQLHRFGVRPGAFGPTLDRRQIEQEILLELPELSWLTINLHGTKVEVQVREVQRVPERIDEGGYYHIAAKAGGIVTELEPEQGDAVVKAGDTVAKGDILISGTVTLEPPLYSDQPERYYYVHARGTVWARTWRELSAVIPLETAAKSYTGTERTVWTLNFFGKRVEFFGKSSISMGSYDKITNVRQVVLPTEEVLPLWLSRETYREYEPTVLNVDQDAAAELLKEQLLNRLSVMVGKGGKVLQVDFQTRISGDMLEVTASGECMEEIGAEIPAYQ